MSVLVGQVYNASFKEEVKDGVEKKSFMFSLASRKAFIEDSSKPNLFTQCVTYQVGLAKIMNEHFGKEENKGKAVVLYGHFDEYEWHPDPNKESHNKFYQPFTIPKEILEASGIKFAEGSKTELSVMVPIKQTTRRFVVTGFEFADSSTASKSTAPATNNATTVKLAGVGATATSVPIVPGDDDTPF